MCNLNCQINSQVGGDHAYCDCECHKDTLPAVPPSRKRRKLTKRVPDALRAYDMGEVAGVKLTYVNGNVFATPAKRR
jgi:hypothetical protein